MLVIIVVSTFHHLTLQRISKRTKMVRELVQEVVGFSPYEKRLLDMLKTGTLSHLSRCLK